MVDSIKTYLSEFEVGRDRRARRENEPEADGPAVRPYQSDTSFPVAGNSEVAKGFPKFMVEEASSLFDQRQDAAATLNGRVHINKTQYFDGVPSKVWNFTVGGYQVCEKWLKDRHGRTLSLDDVRHDQKIVVALRRTDELMREVDAAIPKWPIQ